VTTLRASVILKTDISGSTVRFRALPEADLHALLMQHRELLGRHAAAHDGRIVKPEGDGYWMTFPSVTAAALAAMAMQEELRLAQPNRADDRLAMRVVITLGDVLHEDGALVGDTVVLTARIEAVTPPDEIYLSHAAWLAVNQAEIRTAFVDDVTLKGFADPVPVYRVQQTHRTRILAGQNVVFTDLRTFRPLVDTAPMTTIELVLDTMFDLVNRVTRDLGGVVRFNAGDAFCLTFADPTVTLAAAERLSHAWGEFQRRNRIGCAMNVGVHRGTLYAFRSYFWGDAIEVAAAIESASSAVLAPDEGAIFASDDMRRAVEDTAWFKRLRRVDVTLRSPRHAGIEVYRLEPA